MAKITKMIFDKSVKGRKAVTLPKLDVPTGEFVPKKYYRKQDARLPELSELDVMRHYVELSQKNHFIEKGFYPLGSCTMKYNPKINETLSSLDGFKNIHPLQEESTVQGALQMMYELQEDLAEISGMSKVTLQPVAGAHGEFAGIAVIRAYHNHKGNHHKTKIIMPDSAHGTNPASSAMNGYQVIELKSNKHGMVDID